MLTAKKIYISKENTNDLIDFTMHNNVVNDGANQLQNAWKCNFGGIENALLCTLQEMLNVPKL